MNFNNPNSIVKDLYFKKKARSKIMKGVDKLAKAVGSTLGAGGKCVIYEDTIGQPVITKDGVTVAESVVLLDPVENIGAKLVKQAASNTVEEAGDGTTTATILAHAVLKEYNMHEGWQDTRQIIKGIDFSLEKVLEYLEKIKVPANDELIKHVAKISCNNDEVLGGLIAEAYEKAGKNGVVLMESSQDETTYIKTVDGVELSGCKIKSPHLYTDKDNHKAVLEDPYVLIVDSPIEQLRKIQAILEFVIKKGASLLVIADMEQQPFATLLMNKVKGNIKINIIDSPGFGPSKRDTLEDLALLTGAKVISEQLGDDMDLMTPDVLGKAKKSVTDKRSTVLTVNKDKKLLKDRIKAVEKKVKETKDKFWKGLHQKRLAMLSGVVSIIKVGAYTQVEQKEKMDRVEDALHATKAAIEEGVVPGGGIALLNAAQNAEFHGGDGEKILMSAIQYPFEKVLENANYSERKQWVDEWGEGEGVDVTCGCTKNMIESGIVDPLLVTKSALKNAVSVAKTIISADCVISNMRSNESN